MHKCHKLLNNLRKYILWAESVDYLENIHIFLVMVCRHSKQKGFSIMTYITKSNVADLNKFLRDREISEATQFNRHWDNYIKLGHVVNETCDRLELKNWSDKAVKSGIEAGKIDAYIGELFSGLTDTRAANDLRSACRYVVQNIDDAKAFRETPKKGGKARKFKNMRSFKQALQSWITENNREREREAAKTEAKTVEAEAVEAEAVEETAVPKITSEIQAVKLFELIDETERAGITWKQVMADFETLKRAAKKSENAAKAKAA